MKIINSSVELLDITENALQKIERAGRTCYKSEDKITDTSAEAFCKMIQTRNHESVIEHAYASFLIVCDRGVSHEIVRHRLASYSQESTRYCNYGEDKKGMVFIRPAWISEGDLAYAYEWLNSVKYHQFGGYNDDKQLGITCGFIGLLESCEDNYNEFISQGWTPQQARSVLPNCLKTEIVMTANFREWKHFLKLRCAPAAHPDMRVVANMIRDVLVSKYPVIFSDSEREV